MGDYDGNGAENLDQLLTRPALDPWTMGYRLVGRGPNIYILVRILELIVRIKSTGIAERLSNRPLLSSAIILAMTSV